MTAEQNFDWLDDQIVGLLNDFGNGESTLEETKRKFFEIIFDKLIKQIQEQQDYKQSIIGLIDEMIKRNDDEMDNDKPASILQMARWQEQIDCLAELKQKIMEIK